MKGKKWKWWLLGIKQFRKSNSLYKKPPDNFTISYQELKAINSLKSKIHKQVQDNAKQLMLDDFVS